MFVVGQAVVDCAVWKKRKTEKRPVNELLHTQELVIEWAGQNRTKSGHVNGTM